MSIKADLALAYQMGYDDALGHRRPEPRKAEDMADGIARENAKLRELAENLLMGCIYLETPKGQQECIDRALDLRRELDVLPMEYFEPIRGLDE